MKIEVGKYYRTSDGRIVGPAIKATKKYPDEWAFYLQGSNIFEIVGLKTEDAFATELVGESKWKPIETAPKDTWVLLGYTQQGDEMPLSLMVGVGKVHASGKIWTMNSYDNEKALPSHWRRLPEAP